MDSFLHNVAKTLFERFRDELDETLVVFNNRRAGLFLQKNMVTLDSKPFFLPKTIGIDDLVADLGGRRRVANEFLLFELFDIHRQMEGPERKFETFEEFMAFGEMMVRDFSEVDLYCVDAKQLFENLYDLKRIGEWDVSGNPTTPFQEKYLSFYKSLYRYYGLLRQRLADQNMAYMGMAYREVAENIEAWAPKVAAKNICFVGFNALSASEARIVEHYVRSGRGLLLCDGDSYYYDNPQQEAGLFLRKNAPRFPGIGNFESNLGGKEKTIHIVNCPENLMQAKATGEIIATIADKCKGEEEKEKDSHFEQTAIVLADEAMLLPVLNSLPSQVHSTNVTMGYPYLYSNTHSLVSRLLTLYGRVRNQRFYHVDLLAVISDAMLGKLLRPGNLHSLLGQRIYDEKVIYATPDEVTHLASDVEGFDKIAFLFANPEPDVEGILALLRSTAKLLATSEPLQSDVKEREAMACLIQILDYFDELQRRYHFITKNDTLQKIYQRLAQRRTISFYGEPLRGLQVLGMLETRSLDFQRVVIVSANEGTLPSGRGDNTLIPHALKRAAGIPSFVEKDAVYAYNFYRLIQRAEEVWLIYSSESEGLGKGEPSRYIMQLKDELAAHHANIHINETILSAGIPSKAASPTPPVQKGSKIMERLATLAEKGFAPTALNRYRNCPMQFYYEDLLGVWEQDAVSEELEANELGTFIHSVLCDIYSSSGDKQVKKESLQQALEQLDRYLGKEFSDELLKGRSDEGKNHLYRNVAKMQIEHFLRKEIASLNAGNSIEIVLTEEEMRQPIGLADKTQKAYIKGIADRVDKVNGLLRIADYKSGAVKESDLQVKEEQCDPREVPDKWFQVMLYAWLYCKKHDYQGRLSCGIFPLRSLKSEFMEASWKGDSIFDNADMEAFGQMLAQLVGEILDPDRPFTATPRKEGCTFCPFSRSCIPDEKNIFFE